MTAQNFSPDQPKILVNSLRDALKKVDHSESNAPQIKRVIREVFAAHNLSAPGYIGGVNSSAKTVKGKAQNIDTYIIYLLPSDFSDVVNVCPAASIGCKAACLHASGRASFDSKIQAAQLSRTLIYAASRKHFSALVFAEIAKAEKRANKTGAILSARLNGTSDISPKAFTVDGVNVLQRFPNVHFYDYTKVWTRSKVEYSENYSLTFSHTDAKSIDESLQLVRDGAPVAIPFAELNAAGRIKAARSVTLPNEYTILDAAGRVLETFKVFDGDKTDARFLDRQNGAPKQGGFIVGLRAKRTTIEKERAALASGFFIEL